jgi:hypothetical protein
VTNTAPVAADAIATFRQQSDAFGDRVLDFTDDEFSPELFRATIATFVIAGVLSILIGELALSGILFLTCVTPALFLVLTGDIKG